MKKFFRWLGRRQPPKPRYYTAKCGHQTELEGRITVQGGKGEKSRTFTLYEEDLRYCFNCLKKMATACNVCGKPIIPGMAVLRSPAFDEHGAPLHVVGICCVEFRIDVTGLWTEHGYKDVPTHELFEAR